jgi:hypothetical protein
MYKMCVVRENCIPGTRVPTYIDETHWKPIQNCLVGHHKDLSQLSFVAILDSEND